MILLVNILDMSNSNVDDTTKNIETEGKVIDWEARAKHAEARVQSIRNASTLEEEKEDVVVENNSPWFDEDAFEKKYAEKRFFETNPEMSEYKEQISEYVAKWISYDKAKALVEIDEPSIKNRKVAQNTNFTAWDANYQTTSYTMAELAALPQSEYNKVIALKEQGKVIIT